MVGTLEGSVMKTLIALLLMSVGIAAQAQECPSLLDYQARKLHSEQTIDLCQFSGQVVLVVNTASQCGYTPQFKGLEALYKQFRDDGLVIIGFPSDDFRQEFGDEEKTASVCYINYGVTFPMLATTAVTGNSANPVFRQLNSALQPPSWNFNKYLIDRDGTPLVHFPSNVSPGDARLVDAVREALAETR